LANYEGYAWWKANNSNRVVVFLKRGNVKLKHARHAFLTIPRMFPAAGRSRPDFAPNQQNPCSKRRAGDRRLQFFDGKLRPSSSKTAC
jgi:hypothetical protein